MARPKQSILKRDEHGNVAYDAKGRPLHSAGVIIDVTERTYTIELTGNSLKLDAFIQAVDRASILETVRTGGSGVGRGERVLRV